MTDFVSPEELKQMRESRAEFILIDVRRQIDFDADPCVIPGAIRRAPELAESWASSIPASQPIIVYCVRGGSVSKSVTPALSEQGHDARYIAGGITAWKDSGGEVLVSNDHADLKGEGDDLALP